MPPPGHDHKVANSCEALDEVSNLATHENRVKSHVRTYIRIFQQVDYCHDNGADRQDKVNERRRNHVHEDTRSVPTRVLLSRVERHVAQVECHYYLGSNQDANDFE